MSAGGEAKSDDASACEFEYRGCRVRRAPGTHGWLIVRAHGVTGAEIGEEDTRLELSSLEAVRQYIDAAAEEA